MKVATHFWLSFSTSDGFIGAAIVRGSKLDDALEEARKLRVSGEVLAIPLPHGKMGEREIARWGLGKLVKEADLMASSALYSRTERGSHDVVPGWFLSMTDPFEIVDLRNQHETVN